ncbi:MAG TPA: gephyrin-like molybdotransferase Glp [Candidatus Limnocylindria bacterium]|nr:gephyrin-like molybdotransferase Glp [Candidatus Limnocylindria bacterium]
MISVADALRIVVDTAAPLGSERVALVDACGRVAAEDVVSTRAVPAADNSAMDGFAVRAEDVAEPGARLRIVGSVPAGSVRAEPLARGTAVKIFTGSVVPPGADTVVRVEDTEDAGEHVIVTVAVSRGANVRRAGEDIAVGATVVRAGQEIGPADVGVIASLGRAALTVHCRPRIAIVSTGAELVEVDEAAGPGQVVNSNAYALAAAVVETGLPRPLVLPIVRDRFEDIRASLEEATARADVVLSTGGVSVGDYDFVKDALDAIGVERLFWKVAQKPGKPLAFGRRGTRLVFGLPGNPVSALVCFAVYVWPALRRLAGHTRLHVPSERAVLGAPVRRKPGLTEFVRVHLDHGRGRLPIATPFRSQSSGVLTGLAGGAGLLVAPADRGALEAGDEFDVLRPGPFAAAGTSSVLLGATVAMPGGTC